MHHSCKRFEPLATKYSDIITLTFFSRHHDYFYYINYHHLSLSERTKRGSDRSAIPASKRAKLDEEQQKAAARDKALSASPSIRMLKVLKGPDGQKVEIVAAVAKKWKEIGVLLDSDATGQHLDTIETGYEKDPSSCCQAMFQHWLKGNGVEQTWGTLIDILKDCKLGMLAESVEKVLMAIDQPK